MSSSFAYSKDIGVHSYDQIVAFARKSGVPFTVSSTYRPGAVTVSGNKSLHAYGNAADLVSSAGSMQTLAGWIERYAAYTLELIHSGGKGYFVKNGKIVSAGYYGAAVVSQHYNHVHWGITLSGLAAAGGAGAGSAVLTANETANSGGTGCLVSGLVMVGMAGSVLGGMGVSVWEMARVLGWG